MRPTPRLAILVATLATACSVPNGGEPLRPPTTVAAQPTAAVPAATVPPATPVVGRGPSGAAVAGANAFGFDLHRRLARAPGNLAFSPASLAIALSMTYAGARGATRDEMKQTLHAPDDEALHQGLAAVLASWQASQGPHEIHAVNRLFGERSLPFHAPFVDLTATRYAAPLDPSDFARQPEVERQRINRWVVEQTRERIVDLLPDGAITSATRLVLANALYFKAAWQEPFLAPLTTTGPFHLAGAATKDVPLMHSNATAGHAAVDGVELAELRYAGGRFATLLVLPAARDGLAALEARLDAATLDRWVAALEPKELDVTLPRFRLEPGTSLALKEHLEALGMRRAFGPADFSGISDAGLFVDEIYHKAFVAMDEAGTEAAAATAVVMNESMPMPAATSFRADRPFLFFVRDLETGLVLFAGRVAEP
ncbi:MAG: serpin family protein [Polyangiaceae bacterium]|nr:serpin family protein [Polyangiaceae bacterium]